MSYQKTDWENLPSTNTPLIASNLNNIESGIENNELNNTLLGIKVDNIIGADAYSSSSTYNVGDYCIYNNTLYICKTEISTAEAWNSSHWTATSVTDTFKRLDRNIITAKVSGTTTITTAGSNTNIVGYTQADKVGTLLSVTNNGVVIPAGVSKVLLFGQVRFDDLGTDNRVFAYINRVRGTTRLSSSANSCVARGSVETLTVLPYICSCQEGDYFNLSIQNNATGGVGKVNGTVAGSNYSFLTVEVIA